MISRFLYLKLFTTSTSLYKDELYIKVKKSIYYDFSSNLYQLVSFKLFLNRISKVTYLSQLRRACVVTGRTRAIDTDLSFSRFTMKRKIICGNITGFKKSSW